MKLHGAIKLGRTSVLLNNIDNYVKRGQIRPFWHWKRTFRAIQANPSFGSSLVPFLVKMLLNSFGANGLKVQKEQNLTLPTLKKTFRAIWPNLSFDMWFMSKFDLTNLEKWPLERFNQIYLSICDLCHPKEAPCQKKKQEASRPDSSAV